MADEDFSAVEAKALKSGASKVYVVDLQVNPFRFRLYFNQTSRSNLYNNIRLFSLRMLWIVIMIQHFVFRALLT